MIKTAANNIKYLRNKAGLTQKELSEKAGITQGKISVYEQTDDLSKVYFGTIIRISSALGVTVDEIITPIPEEGASDET